MRVCYMCVGGEQSHHVVLVPRELILSYVSRPGSFAGGHVCFSWIRNHLVRELRGELIY